MDEQIPTTPQRIVPPPAQPEPTPAPVATTTPPPQTPAPQPVPQPQSTTPPPTHKQSSSTLYLIIAGVLCLGILITSMLYLRTSTKPAEVPIVAVTPTVMPTPTPPPNISRIASTSAFAAYAQEIASFSAVLDAFTLQDSTLAPPIMDTDLELSN